MGVSRYEFDNNYWYINQKVISIGDIKSMGLHLSHPKISVAFELLLAWVLSNLKERLFRVSFAIGHLT